MKQILVGIQDLLDQPNPADPAQTEGYHLFIQVANLKILHFSLFIKRNLNLLATFTFYFLNFIILLLYNVGNSWGYSNKDGSQNYPKKRDGEWGGSS